MFQSGRRGLQGILKQGHRNGIWLTIMQSLDTSKVVLGMQVYGWYQRTRSFSGLVGIKDPLLLLAKATEHSLSQQPLYPTFLAGDSFPSLEMVSDVSHHFQAGSGFFSSGAIPLTFQHMAQGGEAIPPSSHGNLRYGWAMRYVSGPLDLLWSIYSQDYSSMLVGPILRLTSVLLAQSIMSRVHLADFGGVYLNES